MYIIKKNSTQLIHLKSKLVVLVLLIGSIVFGQTNQDTAFTYQSFTAKQNCFNSSDGIMKYLDVGKGPVIVLLHGVPTSGWMYRKMIPNLMQQGYRVIVPDMLGFGNSDCPLGVNLYSPQNHAKRLLELMHVLGVENWVQIVHDAGSIWVNELQKQAPNKIEKMVFLNSVLDPTGVNWKKQIDIGIKAKTGLTLQRWGLKKNSYVSNFIKKSLANNKLSKDGLLGYETPMRQGKMEAVLAHYAFMLKFLTQPTTNFYPLKKQTLIIWGEKDNVLLWKPQAEIIKKQFTIKDENIHLLPVGHLLTEESPLIIDSILVNFINPK